MNSFYHEYDMKRLTKKICHVDVGERVGGGGKSLFSKNLKFS